MVRRSVASVAGAVLLALFWPALVGASSPSPIPASGSAPPNVPTGLAMLAPGSAAPLSEGQWIRSSTLQARLVVSGPGLTPQVEVEPASVAFTGTPNYVGAPSTAAGQASVTISGLQNGKTYHWQARVTDASNMTSSWAVYGAGSSMDFGVDQTPPSRPVITSATNPNPRRWYNTRVERLNWTSKDEGSGVAGYSYALERQPHVIPPGQISTHEGVRLTGLGDGVWFVALRAADRAGNWSPTATFRLQLDRQAPRISWLSPSKMDFNPYKGPARVRFTVNKDSRVRLALYRVGDRSPEQTFSFPRARAGQLLAATWSGKTSRGSPVGRGYYFFAADAVDHANNVARWNFGGISVKPEQPHRALTGQALFPSDGKVIIVSLSRERLYAYDGVRLVLQTFVTTGNPNLPTPTGTFQVMGKYHPYEFISPWPQGSPYWYPPSTSQYAMLFHDGGYFLHDAPWRSAFGPGTNGPGQPGSNYGGTHGCINIPPDAMTYLWGWTPVGTPVMVVP